MVDHHIKLETENVEAVKLLGLDKFITVSWNWPANPGVNLTNLQTGISGVGYFWTTQKNTLPLTENPKKYFPKSKTLKDTLNNTIHFTKVKHDTIIMETNDYWSTWWIKLDSKNTVENIKHFKIQLLFCNPKNTADVTSTQKNTDFRNSKPKKYSADPCL